ncbi:MAG: hypothetical protein CL694_01185 [Chloroflexi bacterium]|nr:hypothetical protein [Chloroflexota bacterium]HAL48328.1 hypothetical protein [Dehalococcoidia bacterium]
MIGNHEASIRSVIGPVRLASDIVWSLQVRAESAIALTLDGRARTLVHLRTSTMPIGPEGDSS